MTASSELGDQVAERTACKQTNNHYNTEVVKFDATAAAMKPNGDLARQQADENGSKEGGADFALVSPDYELVEHLIPTDSVNVMSPHLFFFFQSTPSFLS